jgi:ParB family transcriptional regulator, chromosome partitioning protein
VNGIDIRTMSDRNYRLISVDDIVVVNSRNREKMQFAENVRSIRDVGMYKPIVVNARNFAQSGKYELICGEGRLIAHKQLGLKEIKADVLDVDEVKAHLMTLGENIARTPPATIEYGRALKEMQDYGMSMRELMAITGKSESYLTEYIQLIERGEERLIKGVEDGVFNLSFAISVARSSDRSIQHMLMDAFDSGVVNSGNLTRVRKIIEDRLDKGKELAGRGKKEEPYTVSKLKKDIQKITREKESFVQQAELRENRATRLLLAVRDLMKDSEFVVLLRQEGLAELPPLAGKYADA